MEEAYFSVSHLGISELVGVQPVFSGGRLSEIVTLDGSVG